MERIRERYTCQYCYNLHTKYCPIRVWGRNEEQVREVHDIDPKKDYCSRHVSKNGMFDDGKPLVGFGEVNG